MPVPQSLKVTRMIWADASDQDFQILRAQADCMGRIRRDVWHRYGGKAPFVKTLGTMREETTVLFASKFPDLDGTVRNESVKDILNDIFTYKAAAEVIIKRKISKRLVYENIPAGKRKDEFNRRFGLVKKGDYEKCPYLHRYVREAFRHGVGHADNQFIVRSDKHKESVVNGKLVVSVRICRRWIDLTTNTTGKNVKLARSNLRLILEHGMIRICYGFDKPKGRPCGKGEAAVDKGYTEAAVDSNGRHYGEGFGTVMTEYSDRVTELVRNRNKLKAIADKAEAKGDLEKAKRIRENNLGSVKFDRFCVRFRHRISDIAYKTAHLLADNYGHMISEDLTWAMSPNRGREKGKRFHRLMNSWAKGILADALNSVFLQRGVEHDIVNAAFTSQIDHRTGLLQGTRNGDRFTGIDGVVMQADENAAKCVLARFYDTEITRYMSKDEVKQILLQRASGATEHQKALVGRDSSRTQQSADKSMKPQNEQF